MPHNFAVKSKKPIKKLGRAEGIITPRGLCTTGVELSAPEDGSHSSKPHRCLRGGPVGRISNISLNLQRTLDVALPYKLFTKIIPPTTAMQKGQREFLSRMQLLLLKRYLCTKFTKSRVNYYLYHKSRNLHIDCTLI